jgi:hypothetical protein
VTVTLPDGAPAEGWTDGLGATRPEIHGRQMMLTLPARSGLALFAR